MKKSLARKAKRVGLVRGLWFGCVGLAFILMFTALARAQAFSEILTGARELPALVSWYAQSGQWRVDVRNYLTQAEFVLVPNSEAGARLEFDDDDEDLIAEK